MSRVLVLGNAGTDLSLRLPRLPRPGETLVGSGLARAPGGKGLNQAVVASRTGVETCFLAPVGDDPEGRFIAGQLAAEAFTSLRLVMVAHATDVSVLMVGPDGENSIVTAGPCAEALGAAVAAEFASDAVPGDVLLLQGNLSQQATLAAAGAGARRGALVLLNPAPLRWPAHAVLAECAATVANRLEAAQVTRRDDPHEAALALRGMGPSLAVVTLGAAGCVYADQAGTHDLPAIPAHAVDTTGAGDTFCGVLAACFARGWGVPDALQAAQKAAAITIGRAGAYSALPRRDEVARLGIGLQEEERATETGLLPTS